MKLPWFKRIGLFFIPVNMVGWTIFLTGIVYAIYVFIDIDSRSHSASDTIRPFIINLLIIGIVYSLIASFTGKSEKNDKEHGALGPGHKASEL